MTKKENYNIKNTTMYALVTLLITTLIIMEFFDYQFFDNSIANSSFENSLLRFSGGIIFMIIIFRLGLNKIFEFKDVSKALLIVIPALIISINNFPIFAYFDGRTDLVEPVYTVYLFALECLSIGFFEEIIFRGLILTLFLKKLPKTKQGVFQAVVLSSLVFGAVHLLNLFTGASFGNTILQIGYSFLVGMMWAVMYLKTKNIWIVMALHASYNFFGQVIFQLGNVTNRYDVYTIVITLLLSVLVTVYSLLIFRSLKIEETNII